MIADSTATTTQAQPPETAVFNESSYLTHAQYDSTNLVLTIGFRYGGERQYRPFYPTAWLDFKVAPSKGKYFHQAIRSTMGEGMKIK